MMASNDDLSVQQLLRQFGIRPNKRLGQNFLIDEHSLKKIVAAGEIGAGQHVLEIGPGLGSLTRQLAAEAAEVVAVEIDEGLIPPLRLALAGAANVQVVHGDILELDPANLMQADCYVVVANIPYYITSAIIRHLLEAAKQPERIVLTVQDEVARRVCAEPGDLSLLALSVQVYGAPRVVARIPAGAFYPPPKVDSAVVRIDLFEEPRILAAQLDLFFRLIHAGFAMKRKTLRNTLSAGMAWEKEKAEELLEAAGIAANRRAQTLSLEEWGNLVDVVAERENG